MAYCKYCGNAVDGDMDKCPSCGARIDHPEEDTVINTVDLEEISEPVSPVSHSWSQSDIGPIKNYLVWSVLCTIFFFFPFGIPAIVYGILVNQRLRSGDVAGARKASRMAKIWAWAAFAAGIVMYYLIGSNR